MSLLKTLNYQSHDMHQAKCVFGYLDRVEIETVLKDEKGYYQDTDNKDFVQLYLEIFEEMKEEEKMKAEVEDSPRGG